MTGQDFNSQFHFKLGWYVVLNLEPDHGPTIEQRQYEANFSKGKWLRLPAENRGADALKKQLVRQGREILSRNFATIQARIRKAKERVNEKLIELGPRLETPKERKMELIRLFGISNTLVAQAVNGWYCNPPREHFFGDEVDHKGIPLRNLRARVVEESERFDGPASQVRYR